MQTITEANRNDDAAVNVSAVRDVVVQLVPMPHQSYYCEPLIYRTLSAAEMLTAIQKCPL